MARIAPSFMRPSALVENTACLMSSSSGTASMIRSAWRHAVTGEIRDQAVECGAAFAGVVYLALEQLPGPPDGRRDVLGLAVLQGHTVAAQRRPGGNIAAHDAGADHMHMTDVLIGALAVFLQALAQEEDTHQALARSRRSEDLRRTRVSDDRMAEALPPCFCHRSIMA